MPTLKRLSAVAVAAMLAGGAYAQTAATTATGPDLNEIARNMVSKIPKLARPPAGAGTAAAPAAGTYSSYSATGWLTPRCVFAETYTDGSNYQYVIGINSDGGYEAAFSQIGYTTVQQAALIDVCRYVGVFNMYQPSTGTWTWLYQAR
jgi:hypothetical protein